MMTLLLVALGGPVLALAISILALGIPVSQGQGRRPLGVEVIAPSER